MAAATFDRKRPYGTVTSDSEGRAFEQDGVFYRADASLWTAPPAAAAEAEAGEAPAAKPAARKKPAATLDEQLSAQMGKA